MNDASLNNRSNKNWYSIVTFALSIILAVLVSSTLIDTLEPSWGYWPALALGMVAAGAVGGIVGLIGCGVRKLWLPQTAE